MVVKDLIGMFTPNTKFEMITHWVVEYTNVSIDDEIVTKGTVANFPISSMYLMYYDFIDCWIEDNTLYISQEVVQESDEPFLNDCLDSTDNGIINPMCKYCVKESCIGCDIINYGHKWYPEC